MNPYAENTLIGLAMAGVVVAGVLIRYAWKLLVWLAIFAGGLFLLVRFIKWAWTF